MIVVQRRQIPEIDPLRLAAGGRETEQVPVTVDDQPGAVGRPVRCLVEHLVRFVDHALLAGVDVEHMDAASLAVREGAGHRGQSSVVAVPPGG